MRPGRVAWADLPVLLGMSMSSIWRRFRPHDDQATRRFWAERLDIRRRRSDDALHCSAAAVEALRDELATTDDATGLALRSSRRRRFKAATEPK